MRLVAWNRRGLGNGPTVQGLLDVQKKEDPDVLFLSETKHGKRWMEGFRWKLNMTNMVVKDSVGAKGGLALFWKKEVDLRVLSCSRYHIDTLIKEEDGGVWRFTSMYGESRSEEKEKTWKLLCIL
jgi:exonuclease III